MKTKDLASIFSREQRENASTVFWWGGGFEIEKNFFNKEVLY